MFSSVLIFSEKVSQDSPKVALDAAQTTPFCLSVVAFALLQILNLMCH